MKRRDAIKMISVGMGYTLSASSLAILANSCKTEPKITWTPTFFSLPEAGVMEDLLEIFLPATDTPGAKDVGLTPLIDLILNDVYEKKDQEKFRLGMNAFLGQLGKGKELVLEKITTEQLTKLLTSQLKEPSEQEMEKIGDIVSAKDAPEAAEEKDIYYRYSFLNSLRSLALSGYFSSEEVATKHLNYLPVPGPYEGCIPAKDVGNAWAL